MFQQIRLVVWVVGCKNNAQSIRIMLYIPPEERAQLDRFLMESV
eukprot:CCRYP_012753-RA/>CCRYP_012753-RA protein AED:0.40 eAED:1.00 QI:0/-1/0/1/-1/0/1/0/43